MSIEVHASDEFGRALSGWLARRPAPALPGGGSTLVLASSALLWRPLEAVGQRWTAEGRTWMPVLAERERVLVGPVFAPGRDSGCMRCLRVRYEAGFADGPHRTALELLERDLASSGRDLARDGPLNAAALDGDTLEAETGSEGKGDRETGYGRNGAAGPSTRAWSHWSVAHSGACALSLLREHADGAAPMLLVSDLAEASVRLMRLLALHDCECRTAARPGTALLERAFAIDTGVLADGRD